MDVTESDSVFGTSNKSTMDVTDSVMFLELLKIVLWMLWSQSTTMDVMKSVRVFGTFNNSIRITMESKDVFKPFDKVLVDNSIIESGCTFVTFDEAHAAIKRYAAQTNTVVILERLQASILFLEHNHDPYLDAVNLSLLCPDVYNAVSCHFQRKFQGLSEFKMLFMTLCDDKNIVGYATLKETYNTEWDQDGEFVHGIFWSSVV
ncbi:11903_t:CDS:2 [Gigaspora rosea]|nr:11903_t:CDS:2 [Gigaspora rosea]